MENNTILLIVVFIGGILATLLGTRLGVGKAVLDNFKNKLKDAEIKREQAENLVELNRIEVEKSDIKAKLEAVAEEEKRKNIKEAEDFWKDKV